MNMNDDDLRKSDLATEEDNRLRGHISEYEKKIESLMAEVGTLKNEVSDSILSSNNYSHVLFLLSTFLARDVAGQPSRDST